MAQGEWGGGCLLKDDVFIYNSFKKVCLLVPLKPLRIVNSIVAIW